MKNDIKILDYGPDMRPQFEKLNRAWIEKYFFIEPQDEIVLSGPEETFLQDGGAVLMVSLDNEIAGTVALKNTGNGVFELAKMGVAEKFHNRGLGSALIEGAIQKAKALNAKKLVLYSNTRLAPAIHLYRKFGFKEVVLEPGRLARCNIKMERWVHTIDISIAKPADAAMIAALGRESFRDAFITFFNKTEDLDQYIVNTYNTDKIMASLSKPNNIFLLAHCDGKPAGFAKLKKQSQNRHLLSHRQTELQKIYVLKKFHGKGVADALLQDTIGTASGNGSEDIWLDVVAGNERAIRFYSKNGFTRCGDHSFVIGSQTFYYDVMALPLSGISLGLRAAADMV